MIKKISFLAATVTTIVSIIFSGSYLMSSAADTKIIDNSDLMPKYVPDSEVKVNETGTPEWINTLIMAEVRIETCTEEGTFASAVKMLDHYQEMGVNGLWITPVNDTDLPGKEGNRYGSAIYA